MCVIVCTYARVSTRLQCGMYCAYRTILLLAFPLRVSLACRVRGGARRRWSGRPLITKHERRFRVIPEGHPAEERRQFQRGPDREKQREAAAPRSRMTALGRRVGDGGGIACGGMRSVGVAGGRGTDNVCKYMKGRLTDASASLRSSWRHFSVGSAITRGATHLALVGPELEVVRVELLLCSRRVLRGPVPAAYRPAHSVRRNISYATEDLLRLGSGRGPWTSRCPDSLFTRDLAVRCRY